jgi:6-phosphogluconolactonase
MTKPLWLSRRGFVRLAGMTALAGRAGWPAMANPFGQVRRKRFAFVGAMGEAQGIYVYATDGERWGLRQVIASEAPVSLALHPSGKTLYVLNEVSEYLGLPRGSIEAYSVDKKTGLLKLQGRQALSLSATAPRHIAVAPDGRRLVVAVHGGGAYNLLAIHADGSLGRVCGIVKETGCGPVAEHQEVAHPQATVFDTTGRRVIAADLGSDRLSVLSLSDENAELAVLARHSMPAASGPRHLALHPAGDLLYVANALDGSISGFRYDAKTGRVVERVTSVRGSFGDALAMRHSGDSLYAAGNGEVTVWRIDAATGTLERIQARSLEIDAEVRKMCAFPDGHELVALTDRGVLRMDINTYTGMLNRPVLVASIPHARSITAL